MPALAVSQALKRRGADIVYVGSRNPLDRRLVEEAGLPFRAITTGKLRRYFSWLNFVDPFKISWGFVQSLLLLRRYRPDVVFGKGGPPNVPIVKAAALLRIPVILHESDALASLSNRIAAKHAQSIAVSYPPEEMDGFPPEKMVFTGNPLLKEAQRGRAADARKRFRLEPGMPVLLVIGGSQGSVALNGFIKDVLPELLDEVQIVHQVGERSAQEFIEMRKKLLPERQRRYAAAGYFETRVLADLYAASDVIIGRAGAGVTGGIAAAGKPSILIPLPSTLSSDQQIKNAAYFERHGASVVFPQESVTPDELVRQVKILLHNPQRRAEMGRAARKLATLDADEKVADLIWELGNRPHG